MTLGDIFEDMDKAANTFFGKYLPEQKGEHMTEKEYNEIEAVRRSDLMKIRKSPLHYKWAKEHPEEEESTPSQIFGAAAHKYLLELGSFYDEYALAPNVDKRTKAGKEEWERFKAENEGKTVITSDDLDKLWLMQEAVCDHKAAKELLFGTIETPILWTDPETGIECKIRPDVVAMKDGRPIIVNYHIFAIQIAIVINYIHFDCTMKIFAYCGFYTYIHHPLIYVAVARDAHRIYSIGWQ